jgi:hypothetical protein
MVLLGVLAIAYGLLFPDMFAIFDKSPVLILGLASTFTGIVIVVGVRLRRSEARL